MGARLRLFLENVTLLYTPKMRRLGAPHCLESLGDPSHNDVARVVVAPARMRA